MIGFLSTAKYEDLGCKNGRPWYRILEPLTFVCEDVSITIPAGFETDLASVPRLPIIWLMWGDRAHRPAIMHDYLYRKGARPEWDRRTCDEMFRCAIISTKEPWKIYEPMFWGVRLGGWPSYKKLPVFYQVVLEE